MTILNSQTARLIQTGCEHTKGRPTSEPVNFRANRSSDWFPASLFVRSSTSFKIRDSQFKRCIIHIFIIDTFSTPWMRHGALKKQVFQQREEQNLRWSLVIKQNQIFFYTYKNVSSLLYIIKSTLYCFHPTLILQKIVHLMGEISVFTSLWVFSLTYQPKIFHIWWTW